MSDRLAAGFPILPGNACASGFDRRGVENVSPAAGGTCGFLAGFVPSFLICARWRFFSREAVCALHSKNVRGARRWAGWRAIRTAVNHGGDKGTRGRVLIKQADLEKWSRVLRPFRAWTIPQICPSQGDALGWRSQPLQDRGGPCGPAPPTPPCVRVRTRRFGWLCTSRSPGVRSRTPP